MISSFDHGNHDNNHHDYQNNDNNHHDHKNHDNNHHDQVNGLPLSLVALLPLHLQHPPHHQQHG